MVTEKEKQDCECEKVSKENEYLEALQRLQAEFDNFRKRTDREKAEIITNAEEFLISEILNVLDNFELSLQYTKDEGVKMIYSELYSILEKKGLKQIDTKCKFNPKYHEALIKEKGEQDGIILEELQKGYTLNNKVIRTAKVKITKVEDCENEQ